MKKTVRTVRLIAMILAAPALLSACAASMLGGNGATAYAGAAGTGSRNATAENERISASIRHEYSAQADVSAQAIHVETHNGVVTLSGKVASEAVRALAERIAYRIAGVRSVNNSIHVAGT